MLPEFFIHKVTCRIWFLWGRSGCDCGAQFFAQRTEEASE